METSLLEMVRRKKHRKAYRHMEGEETPVIFSKGAGRILRNFYKVDHTLSVKKLGEKDRQQFTKKKEEAINDALARSLNLGYYLITPLLLGLFLGFWLDQIFHTKPFFLLTLFTLGIVGCFYNLLKIIKESS